MVFFCVESLPNPAAMPKLPIMSAAKPDKYYPQKPYNVNKTVL